jgi:hypothetical protein
MTIKEFVNRHFEDICGVAAATGFAGVLAFNFIYDRAHPPTPDDMIRYEGQAAEKTQRVNVVGLYHLKDGGQTYKRMVFDQQGSLMYSQDIPAFLAPVPNGENLANIVNTIDFPVGVELARMLETARKFQRGNSVQAEASK